MTIEFLGYPCIVDARRSGATILQVSPIWDLAPTTTLVQLLNLLPLQPNASFEFILDSRRVQATFTLDEAGRFTATGRGLEVDTFHQLPRIRVVERLV